MRKMRIGLAFWIGVLMVVGPTLAAEADKEEKAKAAQIKAEEKQEQKKEQAGASPKDSGVNKEKSERVAERRKARRDRKIADREEHEASILQMKEEMRAMREAKEALSSKSRPKETKKDEDDKGKP